MRDEKFKERGHHRGGRYKGYDGSLQHGPKTFRRGRAIAFLEMMYLKRSTIKHQLEKPEFHSIRPILIGELKAIDMVINQFIQLFDIHEGEVTEAVYHKNEETETSRSDQNEEGMENDETNE
ncbi:hypothetical protein [Bacillus sp. FJAT-50079]|uniref:hypothetical protein n=1 Tax=Bacillus sp. FJAT-50079 TaxID=2833577 RepID=UPI001BC976B4|nr:hypothetical protein [Bacillus sp. FJAT-50079]MBS4207361.1 hypothetical protein [Bacillus sp. FJAT-50079]